MKRIITALILLTLATPAWAAFDEGLAAAQRGDYATALRDWRPLAQQGSASAQYNLGVMYENGQGVPQDYVQAAKWYRKAAEQGHAKGQAILGLMYAKGQGLALDYAQAVKWWRRAAEQGDAGAQLNLGAAHDKGEGGLGDYVQAHKWYNLAATQGYEHGAKYRDNIAKRMTPAQIAEAQKLAKEWWAAFQKRKGK